MPLLQAEPRFEEIQCTQLVGLGDEMSLVQDNTPSLWKNFIPRLKEIPNRAGEDLYAVQAYPPGYFQSFQPTRLFKKWAAAAVSDDPSVPDGFEKISLNGLYAIFEYQGLRSDFGIAYRKILTEWLPASAYELDDRCHFERLDHRYKQNDPESVEEIWIPIRLRG